MLTTQQGIAVADNQTLRSSPRGPALLEDFILREKITHADHERIPRRIVHARGSGAYGFELTHSLKNTHSPGAHRSRRCRRLYSPVFHRGGRCRLDGHTARRARLCREVLHA